MENDKKYVPLLRSKKDYYNFSQGMNSYALKIGYAAMYLRKDGAQPELKVNPEDPDIFTRASVRNDHILGELLGRIRNPTLLMSAQAEMIRVRDIPVGDPMETQKLYSHAYVMCKLEADCVQNDAASQRIAIHDINTAMASYKGNFEKYQRQVKIALNDASMINMTMDPA